MSAGSQQQQRPDGARRTRMSGQTLTSSAPDAEPATAATSGDAFGFKDIFRDRPTLFKFTAVLGLQMGQVFPSAFFGLILTAIYRENGLPLDMFWVFAVPGIPGWLRPLWAPIVDGVGHPALGLRRTWFIPCTVFGALAYLSLAFFAPTLDDLWIIITIAPLAPPCSTSDAMSPCSRPGRGSHTSTATTAGRPRFRRHPACSCCSLYRASCVLNRPHRPTRSLRAHGVIGLPCGLCSNARTLALRCPSSCS